MSLLFAREKIYMRSVRPPFNVIDIWFCSSRALKVIQRPRTCVQAGRSQLEFSHWDGICHRSHRFMNKMLKIFRVHSLFTATTATRLNANKSIMPFMYIPHHQHCRARPQPKRNTKNENNKIQFPAQTETIKSLFKRKKKEFQNLLQVEWESGEGKESVDYVGV